VSYYRDTATALAQRTAGNFVGVVLYVPAGGQSTTPRWYADALVNSAALEDWYEGIANSPPLYYYIAAFDKTRDTVPVGEAIAPPKPGMPGFDIGVSDRWRHPPFRRATISGEAHSSGPVSFAKTLAIFALFAVPAGLLISKMQERKQRKEEKDAFHRLGLDWSQRSRY
jgi:hypothetical protein